MEDDRPEAKVALSPCWECFVAESSTKQWVKAEIVVAMKAHAPPQENIGRTTQQKDQRWPDAGKPGALHHLRAKSDEHLQATNQTDCFW